MEKNIKIWSLVSGLVAVLVICLVASKILISNPGMEQEEILSVGNETGMDAALVSNDDLMNRLQQMENQITINKSLGSGPTKTFRPADIEQLQNQINILAQQVSELTKVVSPAGRGNSALVKEEMRQFQAAANDPGMRQKYMQYQEDISREKLAMINQDFQQEVVDEQWAVEAEDTIKTNFYKNEALADVDLTSIDCRTFMCRLSVSLPYTEVNNPDEAAEQFVRENELLASLSKDMPQASMRSLPDGKGGQRYEIILFREGYKKPEVQNPLAGKSISEMIDYIERY